MACKLTNMEGVFEGAAGETVTIEVRSEQPAEVVKIFYAGETDGEPPFQFQIKEGLHKLLVAAVGLEAGQKIRVVEVDAQGNECDLRNFFWSPDHFHTTLDIAGVKR